MKTTLNHIVYVYRIQQARRQDITAQIDRENKREETRTVPPQRLNWQEAKMEEKINGQKFTRKRPSDRQGKNTSNSHTHKYPD